MRNRMTLIACALLLASVAVYAPGQPPDDDGGGNPEWGERGERRGRLL